MKRALSLVAVLGLLSFVGCGGGDGGDTAATPSPDSTGWGGTVLSVEGTRSIKVGDSLKLVVTVQNTGTKNWYDINSANSAWKIVVAAAGAQVTTYSWGTVAAGATATSASVDIASGFLPSTTGTHTLQVYVLYANADEDKYDAMVNSPVGYQYSSR